MIRGRRIALTPVIGLMLTVPSIRAGQHQEPSDDSPSEVAWVWFDTLYDVVKSEATAPPPAARIYGVTAVAFYEAVVSGALHHRSLVGQLNGLLSVPPPKKKKRKYHWPTVANAAPAHTILGLFPSLKLENLTVINTLEQAFATQFRAEVKKKDYEDSVAHGQAVADAILAWAATDRYSTINNCLYVANAVPGAWETTSPDMTSTPLQPRWRQLRPMVLISVAECAPRGPLCSPPTAGLHSMRPRWWSTTPALT